MKRLVQSLILVMLSATLAGQLTPVTMQYILNPQVINPSAAGNRGALNVAAFYRRQWVGIPGAPQTISLSVDAPILSSRLGLGMQIIRDRIGVTNQTQFMSSYAYKIPVGEGYLSLGLGAGLMTTNTTWSDLIVLDPGDETYLQDSRVFVVPDFSFGMFLSGTNYFAGFSIPRLLGYQFDYDHNKFTLRAQPDQYYYMLNTGFIIRMGVRSKIIPSALLDYSPGEKLLYDLNLHFNINDRVWMGATYRSTNTLTGLLQVALTSQIKVGYTYDFDFGSLGTFNRGSHEVMIRYEFKYKADVVNPLAF